MGMRRWLVARNLLGTISFLCKHAMINISRDMRHLHRIFTVSCPPKLQIDDTVRGEGGQEKKRKRTRVGCLKQFVVHLLDIRATIEEQPPQPWGTKCCQ